MNERTDLGRLVTDWLQADAPPRASERVLATAIARVAVTPQHRTLSEWLTGDRVRISPSLRLALLAALLVLGLLGGALVASALLRDDPARSSYEAVFLRLEVVGTSIDTIVVAVDAKGNERQITRLRSAAASLQYGTDGPNALLVSAGGASPSGLLALPRTSGSYVYRWEIVDLHRPDAAPIVVPGIEQDFDARTPDFGHRWQRRPSVFWGPGDRVAIPWYIRGVEGNEWHVSLVDGRTGATTSIALPSPYEAFLPYWARDGSGIVVRSSGVGGGMTGGVIGPTQVLRPDGSMVPPTVGVVSDGHSREYRADGALVGAYDELVPSDYPSGSPQQLLSLTGIELGDVAWTADGNGTWLLLPSRNDHELRLERRLPSEPKTVATLRDALGGPGTVLVGWFVGLAPDDSMVIVDRERFKDIQADSYGADPLPLAMIVPSTNAVIAAEGYFAGWLEVDP